MCLAFDPGNQYGQTRVGTSSVTERITIRFNWNASTTVQLGQRYFSKVLTDGPISRINFCTIPEREIGAEMPVYGEYDDAFREALRPYIENLCKASGRIDCAEAFALAEKLKDENADFSRMSQNRVFESLLPWQRYCLPQGLRAIRGKRLQMGTRNRRVHQMERELRPVVQDDFLWCRHSQG